MKITERKKKQLLAMFSIYNRVFQITVSHNLTKIKKGG